jgi:hypothetical protein
MFGTGRKIFLLYAYYHVQVSFTFVGLLDPDDGNAKFFQSASTIYHSTRRYFSEDLNNDRYRCENLKTHQV